MDLESETSASRLSVLQQLIPIPNILMRWREGAPPADVLTGHPVTLILDLVWYPPESDVASWREPDIAPGHESVERDVVSWREQMEGNQLRAEAQVELPDGSRAQAVNLRIFIPADASPIVLTLEGRFTETTLRGSYIVHAWLEDGSPRESYSMFARPISFTVQEDSPLGQFLHPRPRGPSTG